MRVGWGAGYWGVVAAGVGFLGGVAVTGMKKPGVWGTNLTAEEYYRYAEVVPLPVQEVGVFDDIIEREYFSPGLVKKAFAGDQEAQYHLAWCYNTEKATPAQRAEAAYWYLQAARQGHEQSMLTIGLWYLQGVALPQSDREAAIWLRKSAKKGNSWSAYLLGEMYLAGRGVKADKREAIRWLKKGSDFYREPRQRLRSLGIKPPPSQYLPEGA